MDRSVERGELGEALAAAATTRRHLVAVGDRHHLDDLAFPGGDHRPDRRRLGADPLGEGNVLHVAPGEDAALCRPDGGAYPEVRIRGVGVGLGGAGGGEQIVLIAGHSPQPRATNFQRVEPL